MAKDININFEVVGKIRGKQRPRFYHNSVYTPAETVAYEKSIRVALHEQVPEIKELDTELNTDKKYFVNIVARFKIPQRKSKAEKEKLLHDRYCTKKPDLDNITKIVLDALNGVVWKDDKNVVTVHAVKLWDANDERLIVSIEDM